MSAVYTSNQQQNTHLSSLQVFHQDSSPLKVVHLMMTIPKNDKWPSDSWQQQLSAGKVKVRTRAEIPASRWWCCALSKCYWSWTKSVLLVPTFSPTLQSADAAEQSAKEKHQQDSLRCSQVLWFYTPAVSAFPAVKCCNQDAMTMLLFANHQRLYLFWIEEKLVLLTKSK